MEMGKLLTKMDRIVVDNGRSVAKHRVAVRIHQPGSLGGTPVVNVADIEFVHVKSVEKGFDWDSNKIILTLERDVCTLTPEDRDAITQSVSKGQSWHAYQAYKKGQEELNALKALLKQSQPSLLRDLESYPSDDPESIRLKELLREIDSI